MVHSGSDFIIYQKKKAEIKVISKSKNQKDQNKSYLLKISRQIGMIRKPTLVLRIHVFRFKGRLFIYLFFTGIPVLLLSSV